MIYSIIDIAVKVIPIARKYELRSVSIFGSYVNGRATEASDIDFLIQKKSRISDFSPCDFQMDLMSGLNKEIDLMMWEDLYDKKFKDRQPELFKKIKKDRIVIWLND